MSNIQEVKTNIAKSGIVSVETIIKKSLKTLGEALPSHMNAERLVRIALTTMRLNPKLYECTPESFMGALFQSAQLGLEPNVEGQAYIIPFKNSKKVGNEWTKVTEAQFQIGFKGYIELFYRHQNAVSLDMQEVKENDNFDYAHGTEPFLKHKPAFHDRGKVIGYYAVAKMSHGANVFQYMSVEECMEHGKKHSKCWDKAKGEFYANTPWKTEPGSMCKKTVLIQLMKLLPKSIELQKAISMDSTVKTQIMSDMSEAKDTTKWDEKPEDAEFKEEPKPENSIVQEIVKQEAATEGDSEYISDKQRKRLLALANEKMSKQEDVKAYIAEKYDISSTKKIPVFLYNEIINHYEAIPTV